MKKFTFKYRTSDHLSMWRYDCIATSIEDAASKLKEYYTYTVTTRKISFLRSITIDGKKVSDTIVDSIAKQFFGDTIVDVNKH